MFWLRSPSFFFSFPDLPLQSMARGLTSSGHPSSALLQPSLPFSPLHGLLLSLIYSFSLLDCVSFLSPCYVHGAMRSRNYNLPSTTHATEKTLGGVKTSRSGLTTTESRWWGFVNAHGRAVRSRQCSAIL